MAARERQRAAIKFAFWALIAAALVAVVARSYTSGQMAAWYYHTAAMDGYAVNADTFADASPESPAMLAVGEYARIEGAVAVPVRSGDRLPANANGVISTEVLAKGARASLAADGIRVTVPWEIQQAKGFKFKDTFKHKGIRTYAWSAVWNVLITLGLGLALGFMAEGLTDLMGIRVEKIRHFEGH